MTRRTAALAAAKSATASRSSGRLAVASTSSAPMPADDDSELSELSAVEQDEDEDGPEPGEESKGSAYILMDEDEEPGLSSDEAEDDDDDDFEFKPGAKGPPKKKAKRSKPVTKPKSRGPESPASDVKGKGKEAEAKEGSKNPENFAFRLDAFKELPLDLFAEIFSHLEPSDLLRVSRTSKPWRAFLMSKSSSLFVWKRVLAKVPVDLPACPNHLSIPYYVNLIFGKSCSVCGTEKGEYFYSHLHVRVCRACHRTKIVYNKHSTPFLAELDGRTLELVPIDSFGSYSGSGPYTAKEVKYHFLPHIRLIDNRLRELDPPGVPKTDERTAQLEAFIAERKEIKQSMIENGDEIALWYSRHATWVYDQDVEARRRRKEFIEAKLVELGYEMDLFANADWFTTSPSVYTTERLPEDSWLAFWDAWGFSFRWKYEREVAKRDEIEYAPRRKSLVPLFLAWVKRSVVKRGVDLPEGAKELSPRAIGCLPTIARAVASGDKIDKALFQSLIPDIGKDLEKCRLARLQFFLEIYRRDVKRKRKRTADEMPKDEAGLRTELEAVRYGFRRRQPGWRWKQGAFSSIADCLWQIPNFDPVSVPGTTRDYPNLVDHMTGGLPSWSFANGDQQFLDQVAAEFGGADAVHQALRGKHDLGGTYFKCPRCQGEDPMRLCRLMAHICESHFTDDCLAGVDLADLRSPRGLRGGHDDSQDALRSEIAAAPEWRVSCMCTICLKADFVSLEDGQQHVQTAHRFAPDRDDIRILDVERPDEDFDFDDDSDLGYWPGPQFYV